MPLGDEELLLSYEQFPWVKQATVAQITHVERPTPDHLYWPSLEIALPSTLLAGPGVFCSCREPECAIVAETGSPLAVKAPAPNDRSREATT
jgi:hypothetical protein